MKYRNLNMRAAVLVAVVAMMPIASFAQTNIKAGWNLFSPQQDVEIGQQSAQEAQQQLPLVNDSQINAYVNNIGQRLAKNAGGPQFQYQFRVVNSSDINAFALPGGFIFVNRGILESAKNDGEVAGVIAHEIAHVIFQHANERVSQQMAAGVGMTPL